MAASVPAPADYHHLRENKRNVHTSEQRGSSLYWISAARNRLVVPWTAKARHGEVVAEGG